MSNPREITLDYSDIRIVQSRGCCNRYKFCLSTYQNVVQTSEYHPDSFPPDFSIFPSQEKTSSTMTVAETTVHPTACPAFPFSRPEKFEPPAENAELRLNQPISKVKLFDGTECWVVARHSDVRKVLASDQFSAVCTPFEPNLRIGHDN